MSAQPTPAETDRRPSNAAEVGVALIDLGHILLNHPTLNVIEARIEALPGVALDRRIHLSASSDAELVDIEAAVKDRKMDGLTDRGTRAWWRGTLDTVPVVYTAPASHGILTCADCDPASARMFRTDPNGLGDFFTHATTVHGRDWPRAALLSTGTESPAVAS